MASFRKTKSGKWEVRVRRNGLPTISKTFTYKPDAEIWARGVETELDESQTHVAKFKVKDTLQDLATRYLNEVAPTLKGYNREKNRVKAVMRETIASKRAYDVQSSDIANIKQRLKAEGKANSTINKYLATLSSIFTTAAKEWGYPNLVNPVSMVKKLPKTVGRDVRLTLAERSAVYEIPVEDIRVCAIFALETSARLLEIVTLEKMNVDMGRKLALIHDKVGQKEGRVKRVPLNSRALQAVMDANHLWPESKYVFSENPEKQAARVSDQWRTHKEKWGFRKDLWFRDLRHEAISTFFEKGLSVAEVMSITGHTNPAQLSTYTHLMHQTRLADKLE